MVSPIEAAKARHRLADVARRTGIYLPVDHGNWTVRCPLPSHGHPDRSPSLRLYLDQDLWACFGCSPRHANGRLRAADVIDWVHNTEGTTDWREAIQILDGGRALTNAWAGAVAEDWRRTPRWSAGAVERPNLDRTPPERVGLALDAAWALYTLQGHHADGVAYLNTRGIDVQVLEGYTHRAEVGCTPKMADGVLGLLRELGFSDDELVDAALAHRSTADGRMSAVYRQRVLIPVRTSEGRIAGLIGRNIGDQRWPKYKNPPLTHLYNKSVNLYQPLPAPSGPEGRVIVVEGTLDAMAIAIGAVKTGQSGRFCPVTQSGRELSPQQLQTALSLCSGTLHIAFDGDVPGRDSNMRLASAIWRAGRTATIANLPAGADPASWIADQGPDVLSQL